MTKTNTRNLAKNSSKSVSLVIKSEDDLFRMLKVHSGGYFLYRGEDASSYKLRPKVGRYLIDDEEEHESKEAILLDEFKRRSTPYIQYPPTSDLEWMALGQHHGLATRLLDWSTNLFVAAYFAVQNYLLDRDRVIYALNAEGFEFLNHDEDPFTTRRINLFQPKHISPRISAQMGIFTMHAEVGKEFKHPALERWTIKRQAVIELGVTLDQIGFNSATMFPGLDGLATHINEDFMDGEPREA